MKYDKIVKAIFIERPNRFIARVKIDGSEEVESVHVKNTGRCRELLLRGAEVILEDCIEKNPNRKTRYDLIAVKKNKIWVNIDSQAPNKVVKEWLMTQGYDYIKPEYTFVTAAFPAGNKAVFPPCRSCYASRLFLVHP